MERGAGEDKGRVKLKTIGQGEAVFGIPGGDETGVEGRDGEEEGMTLREGE